MKKHADLKCRGTDANTTIVNRRRLLGLSGKPQRERKPMLTIGKQYYMTNLAHPAYGDTID